MLGTPYSKFAVFIAYLGIEDTLNTFFIRIEGFLFLFRCKLENDVRFIIIANGIEHFEYVYDGTVIIGYVAGIGDRFPFAIRVELRPTSIVVLR